MDLSKMTPEQAREVFLMQGSNKTNLFEKLSYMGNLERIEYIKQFTPEQLENDFDLPILPECAVTYRLRSLMTFILAITDLGLTEPDIVIQSHIKAVLDRLEVLNQELQPDLEW